MIEVDVLIYRPRAILPEPRRLTFSSADPSGQELNDILGQIIGCRHIEHVNVLFRNKRADMFVDETGTKDGLPVNEAATLIYHEASRQRGMDMTDAPRIHGIAVVSPTRLWY